MDTPNLSSQTAEPSSLPVEAPQGPVNTIFFNQQGLRSGWRIALYLFQVFLLGAVLNLVHGRLIHQPHNVTPPMWLLILQEALSFLVVFLPALVMSRVERRPAGDYGLPLQPLCGLRLWQGCLLGLVEVSLLMGCIAAFRGYSFGALELHVAASVRWALLWALFFFVVGLFEEFAFRGYLQFTLADGIGFWPAAWILSLGFGGLHRLNGGESWIGAAGVAAIALIFALALKRTGNLWLVVGWHAVFDFGETFLFSVPNSGNVFPGHLSNATLHGPTWLTGGTVGPEGSVFSFVIMGLAALFIHKAFPPRPPAALPQKSAGVSQRTSSETNTN